ncbi:alpha/beta fold hydrolase [Tsukamurella sp. PLM1]|uniref:alpha/beta fold hydrolase n=1 Tax=Tsukamurella sp. PLM1 TaxID=2929795 RepID=UPI00205C9FF9|nr:alpha/beta hydrolase [Tsukamurella sp. PLM1]BDH56534.1 poly(3-hydroxyalkanoic acid) depolymerase [Tsukamurella sp. PLM1]
MMTETTTVEEKYLDISGRKVRVQVHGDGAPLLLINGLGANVSMWDQALPNFDGFQVITFDAPGAGKSEAPYLPYTLAHVAAVAEQVLVSCGHESADVLGYSLGGAVAQQLAHQAPDRVRRLVIVSSTCGSGAVPGSMLALMAVMTPARHYSKSAYRATMRMVNLAPAERDSSSLHQRMVNWHNGAAPTMRGYTLQMMAMSRFNSLPWLSSVQHPTLVVTGSDDRIIPMANAGIIAGYLPNAKLLTFDRWGHYLLQDSGSGAAHAIAEFLGAETPEKSEAWQTARTVDRVSMEGMVRSAPWSAHYTAVTSALVRKRYPMPAAGRH